MQDQPNERIDPNDPLTGDGDRTDTNSETREAVGGERGYTASPAINSGAAADLTFDMTDGAPLGFGTAGDPRPQWNPDVDAVHQRGLTPPDEPQDANAGVGRAAAETRRRRAGTHGAEVREMGSLDPSVPEERGGTPLDASHQG